ncbi:MAG: PDZ domain-containing protein, partial [Candidatus Melainabacteria bacterium]|nr:PDZ domain-containing protein [Candidatus Melainabacteria bacterium]
MTDDLNFDPTLEHFAVSDQPWIGVHLSVSSRPNTAYVFAEKPLIGPVVLKVTPDGPAHKAGIKAGDMIVQVDHSPVTSPESFIECLQSRQIGTVVIVGISREDHFLQLKVLIEGDPGR